VLKIGVTPLMLASYVNQTEVLEALLKSAADPNIVAEKDLPLVYYVKRNQLKIVQLLLDHGTAFIPICADSKVLIPIPKTVKATNACCWPPEKVSRASQLCCCKKEPRPILVMPKGVTPFTLLLNLD
jgi:hypothetical protein